MRGDAVEDQARVACRVHEAHAELAAKVAGDRIRLPGAEAEDGVALEGGETIIDGYADVPCRGPTFGSSLSVDSQDRARESSAARGEAEPAPSETTFGQAPTVSYPNSDTSAPPADAGSTSAPRTIRRFGDYELLEKIAEGGMGVVYKARQESLNRIVAVKMIRSGEFASQREIHRFHSEAQAAARLQHSNIVAIHEVGEQQGQHYFSMDYVEGRSLADVVHENPLSADKAARYVKTIAEAIQYAHDQGLLHRDLKPSNVLIDRNDQPRVTDFGLAREIEGDSDLTATGHIVGTPSYMPPEQADPKRGTLGQASDVYSLGAVLYELLTGRPPFRAETKLDTLLQVLDTEPVALRLLNPKIPRDLETICLKCLSKEPQARYHAAQDLADDLERFLRNEPILARPMGRLARGWRWCRRKPILATLSAVSVASLVAAAVVSFVAYVKTTEALGAAARSAHERQLALDRERDALDESRQSLSLASRRLAEQYHAEGVRHCEAGDTHRGLLWLARSLEELASVEPDRIPIRDLQRTLRMNVDAWGRHAAQLTDMQAHETRALVAVVDADADRLLRAYGTEASLHDLATSAPIGEPLEHRWPLRCAAVSPDGSVLATAGGLQGDAGAAWLWEADTLSPHGQPLKHDDVVSAVRFSPDGESIATASDRTVRFWTVSTGAPIASSLEHDLPVGDIAYSPDGRLLLVGCGGYERSEPSGELRPAGALSLWEVSTGRNVRTVALDWWVHTVAFSHDGGWMLAGGGGSNNGHAQLWEVETSAPTEPMALRHQARITVVAFSQNDDLILTGSADRTVRVWHADSGRPLAAPLQHEATVIGAAFAGDEGAVLTATSQRHRRWRLGADPLAVCRHDGPVTGAVFSPTGDLVATSSRDGTARIWWAHSGEPAADPFRHSDAVNAVAFSPDGTRVLTGSDDNTARLWEVGTGEQVGPPLHHDYRVRRVRFSPRGDRFATAGTHTQLWDATTMLRVGGPLQQGMAVEDFAFAPYGQVLATGGGFTFPPSGEARLWDAETGDAIGSALRHDGEISVVAFSPNGEVLATGTGNTGLPLARNVVQLWNVATGTPMDSPIARDGAITGVTFGPGGNALLATSCDNTARLWDVQTRAAIGGVMQHSDWVNMGAMSPDGRLIATCSSDRTARFWDAGTTEPIGPPIQHDGIVVSVEFSPDGATIVTASFDNTARLLRTPTPVAGDAAMIRLWSEVVTGMALDERGATDLLDVETWRERRQRLEELDGLRVE